MVDSKYILRFLAATSAVGSGVAFIQAITWVLGNVLPTSSGSRSVAATWLAATIVLAYALSIKISPTPTSTSVFVLDGYWRATAIVGFVVATGAFSLVIIKMVQAVPVGTVMAFPGEREPEGWLLCDGRELQKDKYSELHGVVADLYGTARSQSGFLIPDYRGRFLRGRDDGTGRDPDHADRLDANGVRIGGSVGSVQADAVMAHSHGLPIGGGQDGPQPGAYSKLDVKPGPAAESLQWGGKETRPKNIYVSFMIKY